MPHDAYDYAPPAWIRAAETFWSLHGPTFDRGQTGVELGCRRGETLLRLSPFIGRMIGFEATAAELAEARKRTAGKPGVEARPWDGVRAPLPDGSCDLVFVDLAHPGGPSDRAALFAEARRLLKPDGRFLAFAFGATDAARETRDAWTDRLFEVGFALDALPALCAAEEVAAELRAAGLAAEAAPLGAVLLEIQGSRDDA